MADRDSSKGKTQQCTALKDTGPNVTREMIETPIDCNRGLSELIQESKERTRIQSEALLGTLLEAYAAHRYNFIVTEKNKGAFLKLMLSNNQRRSIIALLTLRSGNVAMVTRPSGSETLHVSFDGDT